MGKKIKRLLLVFLILGINSVYAYEYFGKIVYLKGAVKIKRTSEQVTARLSSHIYHNDTVMLEKGSEVKILTDHEQIASLKDEAVFNIKDHYQYDLSKGSLYLRAKKDHEYLINVSDRNDKFTDKEFYIYKTKYYSSKNSRFDWGELTENDRYFIKEKEEKYLDKVLERTIIYPGLGHLYLENKIKGYSILAVNTACWYNVLTIAPQRNDSEELKSNKYAQKEHFKQALLIVWVWSLLDIKSEYDHYKTITADSRSIKIGLKTAL